MRGIKSPLHVVVRIIKKRNVYNYKISLNSFLKCPTFSKLFVVLLVTSVEAVNNTTHTLPTHYKHEHIV